MLSNSEFEARLRSHDLPEAGIAYLRRVRTSPPSRNVSSTGMRNTTWRYASQKMACTIQGESTLERNFLVSCEYKKSIAEFWDQPEPVSVTFAGKDGRSQRVSYTADILAIEDAGIIAYQVKPKKECDRLVEQRPSRWSRTESGYEDVSASEAFASMGIGHRVVTEEDISAIAAENYCLLLQARRASSETNLDQARGILTILSDEGVLTISSLLRKSGGTDSTTLLRLIDDGQVAALLGWHRLVDQDDALIGLDISSLKEVSETRSHFLCSAIAEGTSHIQAPSLDQIKSIVGRLRQLRSDEPRSVSKKTLSAWRQVYEAAKCDPRSLAPKTHLRGNRTRRIGDEDLKLVADAIAKYVLVENAGTVTDAYYKYVAAHEDRYKPTRKSLRPKPISLPTFFAEVNRIPLAKRCEFQGGARLANALAPPVSPSERSLEPKRPFERAHIDHYLIDQHVVALQTSPKKKDTKRAWLTVMIDQATQVVLAISLSFRSPSRHACACVLRDCVRRHGRLPETIVVDHGSEFESIYFEALLACYGVTKHERPPNAPRFGGHIESTFHSIREELIRSLPGSTSNDERGRAISRSHRGRTLASWRLSEVYEAYESYFYRHFNLKVRGTSICSADTAFEDLLKSHPFSGMRVDYDEAFLIATGIPLKQKLTITHSRGVTHHDRWFFHAGLLSANNGAKVDAIEEPWDDRRLYVSVGGKWLTCLSGTGHLANGSMELRMIRSIEFLETQPERREDKRARRVALSRQVSNFQHGRDRTVYDEGKVDPPLKARRDRPEQAAAAKSKPIPYSTREGHLDGHATHRK